MAGSQLNGACTGVPCSLLDTDLYKLTMQQAVLLHFPDVQATYRFTNRDKDTLFSRQCYETFKDAVSKFSDVEITREELAWLKEVYPHFKSDYLEYLSKYRFKPEQVHITFEPTSSDGNLGIIDIEAIGLWVETIFWEVPLMACLSENYFVVDNTDWNYDGQEELAYQKARTLLEAGASFSEFGTRRRRSFKAHDLVMAGLVRASKDFTQRGKLVGTSNVYFARKYDTKPIGTVAHEWFMGIAAIKGYENVHSTAMQIWEEVYPHALLVALTDTFSTQAFFKEFESNPARAKRWEALRQDSGDPFVFAPRAKELYDRLGIDYRTKNIIYSDALNVEKALRLKEQCDQLGFSVSFGIGTFLTNDFRILSSGGVERSKALNIVIKISTANKKPCVKISDDLTKNTGDKTTVAHVKRIFGLPQ